MRANIFDSDCEAIVNTINCVGVMGGGLAKQFRMRYPEMNEAYQAACASGQVKIGRMWNWWEYQTCLWVINFPTKDDWRELSKLEYITEGLKDLRLTVEDLKLGSIAIPALGCGLGGLDWNVVEPLIPAALEGAGVNNATPLHTIEIYTPSGEKYTVKTNHEHY